MGVDPLTLGLAMGGASALSTLVSGFSSAGQQYAQASAQKAQAEQMHRQASLVEQQGQIEAEAIDKQKAELRRQYEQLQGQNRVALGAGNIDLSSGSAMQVAEGNALLYAQDMSESSYQRALKLWEAQNQAESLRTTATNMSRMASYSQRSANNFLPTLLGAALSGGTSFMAGYSFGGKLTSVKG